MIGEAFDIAQKHADDHRELGDQALAHAEEHRLTAHHLEDRMAEKLTQAEDRQIAMDIANLITNQAIAHALLAIAEELRLIRTRPY